MCETIVNNEDQLLLNKQLMDLTDSVMSGNSKLKVQNITSQPIQRMVKHKFQRMFLEDKLYTVIPYLILIVGYIQHLID